MVSSLGDSGVSPDHSSSIKQEKRSFVIRTGSALHQLAVKIGQFIAKIFKFIAEKLGFGRDIAPRSSVILGEPEDSDSIDPLDESVDEEIDDLSEISESEVDEEDPIDEDEVPEEEPPVVTFADVYKTVTISDSSEIDASIQEIKRACFDEDKRKQEVILPFFGNFGPREVLFSAEETEKQQSIYLELILQGIIAEVDDGNQGDITEENYQNVVDKIVNRDDLTDAQMKKLLEKCCDQYLDLLTAKIQQEQLKKKAEEIDIVLEAARVREESALREVHPEEGGVSDSWVPLESDPRKILSGEREELESNGVTLTQAQSDLRAYFYLFNLSSSEISNADPICLSDVFIK